MACLRGEYRVVCHHGCAPGTDLRDFPKHPSGHPNLVVTCFSGNSHPFYGRKKNIWYFRLRIYTPVTGNIAGWNTDPDWRCISYKKMGDITGSYVSLLERVFDKLPENINPIHQNFVGHPTNGFLPRGWLVDSQGKVMFHNPNCWEHHCLLPKRRRSHL